MPTTTPIPESILANVATQLAAITVANSYRNTVATVGRQFINAERVTGTLLPALLISGEEMDYSIAAISGTPKQAISLKFKIQGILKSYSTPSTDLLKLVQDVREKLYADRSRGGYADNTFVSRVEFGGDPFGTYGSPPFIVKPYIGFLMDVEVAFQEHL